MPQQKTRTRTTTTRPQASNPLRTGSDLGAAVLLASGPVWAMAHQPLGVLMLSDLAVGGLRPASGYFDNQDECDPCEENPCEPTLVDGVAVIDLCGPITPAAELLRCYGIEACTLDELAEALEEASADPMAKSIMLRVNSPGGSNAGISDLMGVLSRVREVKPVVAAFGGYAASLACWISCGCTAVHVSPETIGGSIGTFVVLEDSSKMYAERGIRRILIGTGPYKGTGVAGIPVTQEQVDQVQQMVDSINALFLEAIVEGRGLTMEEATALANGAPIVGKDLVEVGLADSVATPREVLRMMVEEGASSAV